jgi:hypothetical protein
MAGDLAEFGVLVLTPGDQREASLANLLCARAGSELLRLFVTDSRNAAIEGREGSGRFGLTRSLGLQCVLVRTG